MDVKKVSEEVRLKQWMEIIKECRESGEPVTKWCKNHNISEPSYYYYLKKIREKACELMPVDAGTQFVPVQVEKQITKNAATSTSSVVFIKGDLRIEISNDIDSSLLNNLMRNLTC